MNAYAGKSTQVKLAGPHPELYKLLRKKRDELCDEKNMPVYLIAGSNTLEEMVLYLPQTIEQLTGIRGFGLVKTRQFGEAFLAIIRNYCAAHYLQTNIEAKPVKRKRAEIKTDTKMISFNLYKQGKTIGEIAKERNMASGTIEEHLTYFVGTGEIDINTIIAPEKLNMLRSAIEKLGDSSHKILKENLPVDISYGEIRMIKASMKVVS